MWLLGMVLIYRSMVMTHSTLVTYRKCSHFTPWASPHSQSRRQVDLISLGVTYIENTHTGEL